ncbi:hypothetical protein [uncultured Exiguobacterium sp.]|uniref:hypothetical protein n=1 Tax=uncultured Exiguobacterium sp. TaxID=202669 RepID=UPI003748EE49
MKWMKGCMALLLVLVLLVPMTVDAKTMSNAAYLKKQFSAAEKGTLLEAKAKLYDRFTIKGKDASYGVDQTDCCVFGKLKGTYLYSDFRFSAKYPKHVGVLMTLPQLNDRKIKLSEVKQALGKPSQHETLQKDEVPAKMSFQIKKEEYLRFEQKGTYYYNVSKKALLWFDYDTKGYVRAFGVSATDR